MKPMRMAVGLAFWCGLGVLLWSVLGLPGASAPDKSSLLNDLWSYYATTQRLELRLPSPTPLRPGDPILAADESGALQQVGIVLRVDDDGRSAQAALFPSAPASQKVQAYYVSAPDSVEWVVRTLLPPERRKQIEDELAAVVREHHQELLQALRPVVENGVRDALAVLKHDLPTVIDHHRPQLQAIATRFQTEILKGELVPLVREQVWPIVRRDAEPLVREISAELWERISLWRFAWRGALDHMPLVRGRDRVEMELQRFVDEEAAPILQSHQRDYLTVVERIVRDVAENDAVRAGFSKSFTRVATDPELRRVVNDILHEAVVDNPRFWQAVRSTLASPEAQDAMRLAGDRFEPAVRRIGDIVLGTREDGLTPEFTKVLRQQVLLKDRQAIVLGKLPASEMHLPCTPIRAWLTDSRVASP